MFLKGFRLFGTALCFTIFSLGGVFLSYVLYTLLHLFIWKKPLRIHIFRQAIGLSFKLFLFILKIFRIADIHASELKQLKNDRGCLWLCNHPSLIDYVIICSNLPQLTCIVKGSLFKDPFLGATIRTANYIPNLAQDTLIKDCTERLAKGENILIFPEGTRTKLDATEFELKRGAANLAIRCKADVHFIHVHQKPRILAKEQPWHYIPKLTSQYHFSVGKYLKYEEFACTEPEKVPLAVRHLTQEFAHIMQEEEQQAKKKHESS